MNIFSEQEVYCRTCGKKFKTNFSMFYGGEVCNKECFDELEWKKTLALMGKGYYQNPRKIEVPSNG